MCVGSGQIEGRDYYTKQAPTPNWSTTLILIAEGTIEDGEAFQFDMTQYFQRTECETPSGKMLLIPPPNFQRYEYDESGNRVRVLW